MRHFAYGQFDELASVSVNTTVQEVYLYDALGRLAATVDTNGKVTQLVSDGDQVVESYVNGGRTWMANWAPGIDNLLSVEDSSGEYFALDDGRGSVIGWSDSSDVQALTEYTPEGRGVYHVWGAADCTESGASQCPKFHNFPFGFHSGYSSAATGLIYFRNRWYSPEMAQWLSQDPMGNVDSFNQYAYVGFDPVNHVDPTGLKAKSLSSGSPDEYIEKNCDKERVCSGAVSRTSKATSGAGTSAKTGSTSTQPAPQGPCVMCVDDRHGVPFVSSAISSSRSTQPSTLTSAPIFASAGVTAIAPAVPLSPDPLPRERGLVG